jgi:hypothetical protein
MGHFCRICGRVRANERFTGHGHRGHICQDCQRLPRAELEHTWVASWKARNWRTADRKPVKNDDLWRQLDELCARHKVQWRWLKGHAGHPDNERCDQLARAEISKLRKQYTAELLACLLDKFEEGRSRGRNQGQLL